jgi:hypothetical protein
MHERPYPALGVSIQVDGVQMTTRGLFRRNKYMDEGVPNSISYRDFMRARRPELYSDTLVVEESSMERRQFEFHLDTLTQRKEETLFETFARVLAEKELCPNLLPQTGPTGGGDSKVDTETYPVSEEISDRWYEGEATRAGSGERWAFAISAMKAWKPKVQNDIRKIAETGRSYSLIYFISNQAIRDKARAEVEDELRQQHSIEVRILDRSWIVEKVSGHRRWDIVAETLHFQLPQRETKAVPGPRDAERLRDLEKLDARIADAEQHPALSLELIEDCLRTALLARGLGRPRTEVDGRFARAERLAQKANSRRQLQRIWYQRAWTAVWWFDDYFEADRIYDQLAPAALAAEFVWEVEDLVNLWLAACARRTAQDAASEAAWMTRTTELRAALQRHADDDSKVTNSLWARTQLLLMELTAAIHHTDQLPAILASIQDTLAQAKNQIEFPVEPLVKLIRELGHVIGEEEPYDKLLEAVIELQSERHGNGTEGEMRLERGQQKLAAGKTYDAIDQFAKAQMLLAQDERRDEFVAALAGTGLAYESAGLLWAARANLISALDRCLYAYFKFGKIDDKALPLTRKLIWLEMQLGRVPYVLCWIEWLRILRVALSLTADEVTALNEEVAAIDRVLGILVLRTQESDWAHLDRIADLFESHDLMMSRAAVLFILGHEDRLKKEYSIEEENLQEFFSLWLHQPAADDLPLVAQWHVGSTIRLETVVLGCKVEVTARGGITTALLAESFIAFLEAFFSTAIQMRALLSPRPELSIEVRQSDQAASPFSARSSEDDCGETKIVVTHPVDTAVHLVSSDGFEAAIFELFARVVVELQIGAYQAMIEDLFAKHRAQDRAFHAARSIIAVDNILGHSPRGRAEDWNQAGKGESFSQVRVAPWQASEAKDKPPVAEKKPLAYSEAEPSETMFGVDGLKHRDLTVMSPINMRLWDKARWNATGFAELPAESPMPRLILVFADSNEGRKIFRGWRKKVGAVDTQNWIGLTIITGISRSNPHHYRLTVSVSESYIQAHVGRHQRFAMVYRMHDMTPVNEKNLRTFLDSYSKASRFVLQPGTSAGGNQLIWLEEDAALGIELNRLAIVPAWEIGPGTPLMSALGNINDPLIPKDAVDPPILRALERLNNFRPHS